MTNREWLGKMCFADMFNFIIQNNEICTLNLFDKDCFCSQKPPNDICYNCVCKWLNKKHEKIFHLPLDK